MDSNFGAGTKIEEKIKRKNGEVFVRKWTKGRFLGKGGFAKVYEFTNMDSKRVYAAKVIQKSSLTKKRAKQKLISEIKIHKSLNHKHVVGFEHYFEDSDCVYILLELCPN
jgi:polo-like kinase 1